MICPITSTFEPRILELNNRHARELSWLEPEELSALLGQAYYAGRIGDLEAFLLAFNQSADYRSPNFLWFRERHERFVYVDRIAVAGHARGRGHARLLYEDLFARAIADGYGMICCEVNADPPNPASDAFHAALGFAELGQAEIHGGTKSVRYYGCSLKSGDTASRARPTQEGT